MGEIKQVAIDLSNACSKGCWFCYNHSADTGDTLWQPDEVIQFALDCFNHGVEAFSLGGGEPFEYDGVFEIIDAIKPKLYTTVTSNGLELEDQSFFHAFLSHLPDKLHISMHCPEDPVEVHRVVHMIQRLDEYPVATGVNLLVSTRNLEEAREAFRFLLLSGIRRDRIIVLPMKYQYSPTADQLKEVTGGRPFQGPSCLLACHPPVHYCSVTWDKKACPCSYSPSKVELDDISYDGLVTALEKVSFVSCQSCF